MRLNRIRGRHLIALAFCTQLLPVGSSVAAASSGSFSHQTSSYSIDLFWAPSAKGSIFTGTLNAAGRTATVDQVIRLGEVFVARQAIAMAVRAATVTPGPDQTTLRLDVWSPVEEVSGSVTLTFFERRILQRSEFHLPSGAFAPTVESTMHIAWSRPFAMSGSATSSGDITFDDGTSLAPYGEWQDAHRYGVFLSDLAGGFVGHARIAQGDMANYLNEGEFKVGDGFSRARTFFNGFLDSPTTGLGQSLWALDALVFMPDGSTPGAYAALLANFPGFQAFEPPSHGDLAAQGQVVIAVADTGINPYHEDFRNPDLTAHPSTYIAGFPASAPSLPLTFGAEYAASRNADDGPVWSKVQTGKLYWIPGTKIIGAISIGTAPASPTDVIDEPAFPRRPIIDDQGHGTGVASVSTGYRHGICEQCLLVVIEGTTAGVAWAASQPWIDLISNSYGPTASLPIGDSHQVSLLAYRAGKSVLYSAGNGMSGTGLLPDRNPSFTRPTSGPSWVIAVGAASPRNDQDHSWHGIPSDVISYGSAYPAAASDGISSEQTFSGTSCATPITAGVEGALLLHARRALGDVEEGTTGGAIASVAGAVVLPPAGPLADGSLTRDDLEQVLLKTAIPTTLDPNARLEPTTVPGTPVGFLSEGYGLVNRRSLAAGIAVLDGTTALPERPQEDAWIAATDQIRDALWGEP